MVKMPVKREVFMPSNGADDIAVEYSNSSNAGIESSLNDNHMSSGLFFYIYQLFTLTVNGA